MAVTQCKTFRLSTRGGYTARVSWGVPLSVLVSIVCVAMGRRAWKRRALLLALPGVVVVATTLHALLVGREALLSLLESPEVALATRTLQEVPALESQGFQAAAATYLVLACSELAPVRGSSRDGLGWVSLGLGAVAMAGLVWLWSSQGGQGAVGMQVLASFGVATLAASMGSGFSLRTEDAVGRAVTAALALVCANTALYVAAQQDWLAAGFSGADDLAGRAVNLGIPAAVAAAFLGLVPILSRRFWRHGDRFAIEMVIAMLASGSALIFHMPVNFLQDRVLPYTLGGQVVVLQKRLVEVPEGTGVPVEEYVLMRVDERAFDSRTGRPVDEVAGQLVAMRPDEKASSLVGSERGLVVLPPDQPKHPSGKRLHAVPLVWSPEGDPREGTIDELLQVCGDPCVVQP